MTERASRLHGPGCGCRRCRGFETGNLVAVKSGAWRTDESLLRDDETRVIAEAIRSSAPVCEEADGVAAALLAVCLRRVSAATAALAEMDSIMADKPLGAYNPEAPMLAGLREDARKWVGQALKLADALGMTPTSRARLGLDVARARRTMTVMELHAAAGDEAS